MEKKRWFEADAQEEGSRLLAEEVDDEVYRQLMEAKDA